MEATVKPYLTSKKPHAVACQLPKAEIVMHLDSIQSIDPFKSAQFRAFMPTI